MRFEFTYKNTALELWLLHLYYTYGSIVGVCNILFTAGMLALIYSRWESSSAAMRSAMVLGALAFPVIQPIAVYGRAKKSAQAFKEPIRLALDKEGVHISARGERERVLWKDVKRLSRKPGMLILFTDASHGYILTDRIVGRDKEALYAFLKKKIGDS